MAQTFGRRNWTTLRAAPGNPITCGMEKGVLLTLPFSGVVQKEMRKNTASVRTQNIYLPVHDIVIIVA
jgi:hypothetical protein